MKEVFFNNKLVSINGNVNVSYQSDLTPTGYWIHKDTGVRTNFGLDDPNISGTTYNTPSYLNNAKEIKLPQGITNVGDIAFNGASDLETLSIPSSTTTFGTNILSNTANLRNLYLYSDTPPSSDSLGSNVGHVSELQLKVPAASYDAYRQDSVFQTFNNKLFVLNDLIPGSRVHSGYSSPTNIPQLFNNQNNIIIENIHFDNTENVGSPYSALELWQCDNVIIRNCKFTNILEKSIYALESTNITIYNCDFEDCAEGIRTNLCENIRVFSNDFKNFSSIPETNIKGRSVFLDGCIGDVGIIQDNVIEHDVGESNTTDYSIQIRQSNFSTITPLRIRNNWIRGGGSAGQYASGGIMVGLNFDSFDGSNQIIEDNILVNPGNAALNIRGGSNQTLQRNIIYSEPRADLSHYGIVAYNDDQEYTSENITIRENRIYWLDGNNNLSSWFIDSNVEPVIGKETNVLNDLTVTPSVLPNQIIGL